MNMTTYAKLMNARLALQGTELTKTGRNKFAGYDYFELGDFLPTCQKLLAQNGLAAVISFGATEATLTIIAVEKPEEHPIKFCSPMAKAELKGCHEIQNLGACQTYLRRYLYVAAFEIVEHNALDATTDKNEIWRDLKTDAEFAAQHAKAEVIPDKTPAKAKPKNVTPPAAAPAAEVPRDIIPAPTCDLSKWEDHEIHFGKNKGVKIGELDNASLNWYIDKWLPKPYQGKFTQEDINLRAALDAAAAFLDKKS
jgi:hypothetical protein